MKIAISLTDQSFTHTKSMGIFNVSMGLTRGLMRHPAVSELHILGNNECADVFSDIPPHVHLHLMNKPVPRRFARVWWDQFGLQSVIRGINPDWLILPKGFPPFLPRLGRTRIACYVHDVIWEYYNQLAKTGQNPFPWYENIYFPYLGKKALRTADIVLTSTKFNSARFREHAPSVQTAVVGIGFDTPPCAAPIPAQHKKDILFFASTFPHKLTHLGVPRLEAWLRQVREPNNIRIHCIGHIPTGTKPTLTNWKFHGRISPETLEALMQNECRLSVYFSAYEGFGMPPVESLRAGLPCVCSDIPPIRENIPEMYLFDNDDEHSFIRTMNSAYSSATPPLCPDFPSWQQVTHSCVKALQNA